MDDFGLTITGNKAVRFYNSSSNRIAIIPDGISVIGEGAFRGCQFITDVRLPDSLRTIQDDAFNGCEWLSNIALPSGVNSIGKRAFANCTLLKSIAIPEGVGKLKEDTFSCCPSLKNVSIPASVSKIEGGAFYGCKALESITIPSGQASIEETTFHGCKTLKQIDIPESVTEIGDGAFCRCESLTHVVLPKKLKSIGRSAFAGLTSLKSVSIPETVRTIEASAFANCTSLESVFIPAGVTSIGAGAFEGCKSLESVYIPEGVTSIGERAFANCSSLESVFIPETVRTISNDAFAGCESLRGAFAPNHPQLNLASVNFEGKLKELEAVAEAKGLEASPSKYPDGANELSHLESIIKMEQHARVLRNHLASLYELESGLESRERALCAFRSNERRNLADSLKDDVATLRKSSSNVKKSETSYLLSFLTPEQILGLTPEPVAPNMLYVPEPRLERPQVPQYEKPGFFNKRKVEEQNAALRAEYESKLSTYDAAKRKVDEARANAEEEYARECEACRRQANQRRYEIERAAEKRLRELAGEAETRLRETERQTREAAAQNGEASPALLFVRQEIESAEENALKALMLIRSLYAQGVVHPKYANFLAVCTLYDYLDTGRCTELAGPNGAYNLYESELRANTIISKLESIEGKLDDIRDVQYSAYATLTSVKSSLASIDGKLSNAVKELARMSEGIESIEKSSAATAYHAEAAAYYAKVNAEIAAAPSFGIIF